MEKREWEKPIIEKITDFDVHESVVATSEYQIPNQGQDPNSGGFFNNQ